MTRTTTRTATQPMRNGEEVSKTDRVLLETPEGRENDFGASDRDELINEEIERPEISSHPRSETTGRHDEGSGANETLDGLDQYQEAIRHAAEDIPAAERRKTIDDVPV